MLIKDITSYLEEIAPIGLQESYDNSGLLLGSLEDDVEKVLITLDITDEVLDEAISENCQLVVAHHPLIFGEIKKLTGGSLVERLVVKAIKADISIYAIHTNLDNVTGGVNSILAKKLGIKNSKILKSANSNFSKVVCFCPTKYMKSIQQAMFDSGAGNIGNYDSCSYYNSGIGTFRALEGSDPYVGEKDNLHFEDENRLEVIVPKHNVSNVVKAMKMAHPYEEPAYDIYKLENFNNTIGSGMIGELEHETTAYNFLNTVKNILGTQHIKHSKLLEKPIKKVAICGGSGSFLIGEAARQNADIFITGDIKYHDFFDHTENMVIADAGHFETEQPVKELLYSLLKKKFPNFALQISKMNANPISFL